MNITLYWLPHFAAYIVRLNGKPLGLVKLGKALPFKPWLTVRFV